MPDYGLPTLLWKTDIDAYTVTSEVSGFEGTHLLDGNETTQWKATSTAVQYITYDAGVGNTIAVDYMFLSNHNLGTVAALVSVEYSDDASAWNPLVAGFTPSDDKAIAKLFTQETRRAFRIKLINMTVAPYMAVALIGSKVELINVSLYGPYKHTETRLYNETYGGRIAGSSLVSDKRHIDIDYKKGTTIDDAIYTKLADFFETHGAKLCGYMWAPTSNPTEVWPMIRTSKTLDAPFAVAGVLRNTSIKLEGVFE